MRRPRTFLGPQAMGGLVALWGASSLIRSVQRGTITLGSGVTSDTATIAAVDLANTRILWLGTVCGGGATIATEVCRLALTNATTVTATVNTGSAPSLVLSYEVIEYAPGVIRSVQRGTGTSTADPAGTATITAVNTAKSTLDWLGFTSAGASTSPGAAQVQLVLTNTTTITMTGVGAVNRTFGYQVTEWF